MLKAPVRRSNLPEFEGTEALPGTFRVPMLLLALLVGAPREAATILGALLDIAERGRDPSDYILRLSELGVPEPAAAALERRLDAVIRSAALPAGPEAYTKWIPRVARFSFDAGKAVQRAAVIGGALRLSERSRNGGSARDAPQAS
jgi:hypothetical protein